MATNFVPLHVHSQYSILDATASVKEIAAAAKKGGMEAVALTDGGNLYGAVEFYQACQKAGVKPLIGCEVYVAPEDLRVKKKCLKTQRTSFNLELIAKDNRGYQNLCKLTTIGFLEGFYYDPRIDMELLKEHREGLLCLTGDLGSRLSYEILSGTKDTVLAYLGQMRDLFGDDLYLEVMRHPMTESELKSGGMYEESWLLQSYRSHIERQERVNKELVKLSKELGIKLVATNDTHYLDKEDWRAHEVLLNIQSGEPCEIWERDSLGNPLSRVPNPKRRAYPSHAYHFPTKEEMGELFKDLPEALATTKEVADKCSLKLDLETKHYPVYYPPALEGKKVSTEEQKKAAQDFLWQLCHEGIERRYTPERLNEVKRVYGVEDPMDIVKKRLQREMDVIVPKEMSDYLLIVWDFIHWAKKNGIPVGPGRGSGAGSIVLYLIGVTDIEPLRFHLFFERFINPERVSYPDIDVDICMDRRGEVINYTLEKYGKENVAQIITFGTMKAKMAVKDVGRVLNVPLTKVNNIAKLIPEDLNITLEKALEKDPDLNSLYQTDEEVKRVIDLAMQLEGSIRNTGIHAAGLVISGEPLTEYIPLTNAKDSNIPATQFSMKPVEQVGMLKIDFLGLKTLTSIKRCVDAIHERTGQLIDWINMPLDDKGTFDLLNQGKTLGVFQMESTGMQELAKQLHLDKFEEIIAVGSLYRPGPMDMIPSFIDRKHGREKIEIDHPWMEEILKETYGIMVYQEQVMQIASKLANYSLGEGDILRKAMGKKELDKMAEQREKFRLGCLENGIDEGTSMSIFDKMEKFASYGFNKSHAAAYGYLTYVTAYLKAHYPKDWMAALMSCDAHDISKVSKFIGEAKSLGIPLLSPDINESMKDFFAAPEGIRFGLGGIKGLGDGVVDIILEERKLQGPFKSLYHFMKRIDLKKVGKKSVELLIDAGCFTSLGWTKDALRTALEPMYESLSVVQKESESGFLNLFESKGDDHLEKRFSTPPKSLKETSRYEELLLEKELLGFFLTGHPLELYKKEIDRCGCVPLSALARMEVGTLFRASLMIEEIKIRFASKTQKKFAILKVSDQTETFELPIWPDLYENKGHLLIENRLIFTLLQLEEEGRISCRWLDALEAMNQAKAEECDKELDRIKGFQMRPKKPKMSEKMEKSQGPVKVQIDARKCQMSQILSLKDLLRRHSGSESVEVAFHIEGSVIATVQIGSPWGVEPSDALFEALRKFSS